MVNINFDQKYKLQPFILIEINPKINQLIVKENCLRLRVLQNPWFWCIW